jgi:phospholipase/lecithinase/hemolysin
MAQGVAPSSMISSRITTRRPAAQLLALVRGTTAGFLFFIVLTALCPGADYKEIVAFGDSLSDMGNRSVARDKPAPKLRETWIKQLAGPSMLNIADFKPSGISFFNGGTNYAVGGATTEYLAARNSERNRAHHLTQQISKRYLNPAFNTDGVKKDALHVIVIGTNDLGLASIAPEQFATRWAGLESAGIEVAKSTEKQIQALAAAGVRYVVWGNLFDGAQAPSVVSKSRLLGPLAPTALAALTKATVAHNTEMDAAMERLSKANPSLRILKLDLFALFADIAADPAKYGFATVSAGANDNKHLFSADGLHPTTQGHKVIAKYAYDFLSKAAVAATSQPALGERVDR